MKRRISLALAALLIVAACSQNALSTAYKTIGTIQVTVDTGMKIYADMVVAGKVPQATQDKVKAAYGSYFAAMQVAKDSLVVVASAPTGTPSLDVAVAAVEASANDLLTLLRSLGVKV